MKPDAKNYNPGPAYLRELINKAGLSQRKAAETIGISDRSMRMYLADRTTKTAQKAPYPVQFALECLAEFAKYNADSR